MLDGPALRELFSILKELHSTFNPDSLWRYVLERSCMSLQAQGGSFFLIAPDGRMELKAAVGVDEEALKKVPLKVGTGICGWCAEKREPVLVDDVHTDTRFNPMADQVTGRVTQSLLCIPIFSQQQTYGVIELVNRLGGGFKPEDQEFMTVLGAQAAIAYQNLLLLREMSHTKVLMESLLINMSGGLIAIDRAGLLTILNPAARQLLHLPETATIGKPAVAVLMEFPVLLSTLNKTLASGSTVSRMETPIQVGVQDIRIGYSTILIADPSKNILGAGIIFQRLT